MGTIKAFHPIFVKNQLLTSTQLNQLFNYLDKQDRDSRVKLTGTGKVCGLNWEKRALGDKIAIAIAGGYGITSDGYLITLAGGDYTHYRRYIDPDVVDPHAENSPPLYEDWQNTSEPQGQIEIYELETTAGIAEQEGYAILDSDVLSGRVLVLYMERQSVDLSSCLVTDCDSKGRNIEQTVRVLLVPRDTFEPIEPCPTILPMLRVRRLHTKISLTEVNEAGDINQAYQSLIAPLEAELKNNIIGAFTQYGDFLGLGQDMVWLDLTSLFNADQVNQYHYDVLKDLICAYNEMVSAACELITDCCPGQDFPRHLMLGAMDEEVAENGDAVYCNEFRPSPVKNVMQGDLLRVRQLFLRLRQMVEALPADFNATPAIRMTPSHTERYRLGQRAIPWYFDSDALRANWQPALCCTTDRLWDHPTHLDEDYNLASLLCIEGHQGRSCDNAIKKIEKLRTDHNAEFCLLHLRLNDTKPREDELHQAVMGAQLEVLKAQSKFRQLLRDLIDKLNQRGELPPEEWLPLRELHRKINELEQILLEANLVWADFRCNDPPGCDVSGLSADHQVIRAELLAMLSHLKQLVDGTPDPLDEREELSFSHGIGLFIWLAISASTLRDSIDVLKRYYPKDICAFNHPLFLSKYKVLINNLIDFLLVYAQLNEEQSSGVRLKISTLPQLELPGVDHGFGILTVLRSAIHARLAPLYYRYQMTRDNNSRLFKDFARRINGMEHLAGVEKGGAFILVCDENKDVVADFSLAACPACCCTVADKELCLPPVAVPDYIAVEIKMDNEVGRYLPVDLEIDVMKSDFGANNNPSLTVKVERGSSSELGGECNPTGENGRIHYRNEAPVPGTIDRFSYMLEEKSTNCRALDEGHVLIFFYVTAKTRLVKGQVLFRNEFQNGARVTIKETNDTTITKRINGLDGAFIFPEVKFGTYTLWAVFEGRRGTDVQVTVDENTPPLELRL